MRQPNVEALVLMICLQAAMNLSLSKTQIFILRRISGCKLGQKESLIKQKLWILCGLKANHTII